MSAWDEQPEYQNEVADLETARLALRGAIQSVRSLQDLNGKLKGEVQDFLHREKALNERLIRLQTELNDSYARLDAETAHDREREAATRETLRQEIVAEQNHKWQSEIDALRQSVQNWTEVRRQKETELKMLKETLLSKEQEVFTLQKEKIAAEENAHREILETIKRSREGVAASVEKAILTKEKEISDLQRKLAAQPKIIEERMQQIEQDLHRKEQSLLLQFRDRQQSLEMDWAHREKELWEKATEAREALEHELKSQWDERRKTLEETFQKRQTTLEIQAQQQFEEYQRRSLSRDEELHKTWAAKEASLAQEWASREKEMARQFQATLDQERLRASEQATQLKNETDLWRKNHDETLRRKEDDFNKAYVANEQLLRNAYRKKEEDLLARHQEALELAQHQISELMTRTSDKEGFAKVVQERLTNAVKERDAMAARLNRLESDSAIRQAELEKAVEKRDEELARLNQTFTTQDESRISQIQNLERDQLHKDSELKVLREKILQAEADRKTALEHAATLESEFAVRQQQLEEAFRKETETLGERLAASSHESAERQQTDQRKIAELTAEAQQRTAEIQGLTHQLQLTRHDIEKITQDAADKQTKSLLVRRQLEERLVQREAELAKQIETLEKERFLIEERLDARVAELEQELGRRLSEDRALQERFRQSEEFRTDAEKQAEELRDRLNAHEKLGNLREEEVRAAAETAEKERIIAEQKLQLRIGELEASLVKQEGISAALQEQLARSLADRQEELRAAQMREARLETRAQTLEQQLKAQEDDIHARLSSVQLEHARIETALRQQIQEQDAAHMKTREQILGQAAALEGDLRRRELEVKTLRDQIAQEERTQLEKAREQQHREAGLEERVQFLYKSLEAQKAEHEAQVESADHVYLQQQDALRAQVLQLETELGRKTTEAADLLARLTHAQTLHAELRESVSQLEARTLDREQALRAATQTHMDSEHKLEIAITDLKAAVQKRDADVAAAEKALHIAQRERQAEAAAAAQREKQLEERAQTLDEKLHSQKDQITQRLTGVERQRLQNEETLHTRTLDLEQRLAEKTGLVKGLQDQLTRANADHEHLEKKMATVEAHLSRADQQLKARETEFQSLKSTTQKEVTAAQEAHQRKLLELQGQKLSLEADLKGVQEALQHTEEEKKRLTDLRASLEERLRTEALAHQAALEALLKERQALEESYLEKSRSFEETLTAKTNALQALENRLSLTEEQRADRDSLAALLQKEIHELQLSLAAQQEEFRSRMAGFEKERSQLQETQQNRITHLESQLQYRESALRSLEEKITLANADHEAILEAATEREQALLEKAKSLETVLSGQTKEWQTRMEGLLADRMKTETELHSRVVNLQETLSVREKELVVLKETLTQTEATHIALAASSDEAITFSAKERQALEERVLQETGRVRDLESQLRGHSVHIKEMEKSLAAGMKEREFLQVSLDALRQRLEEEVDTREKTHADKARLLENKMEAVEREWRERLEESSKTSVVRVDALQGKVVELECALGVRENDLSALRQSLAELTIERERLADLVSVREQENRTILEAATHDKEEFAARLAAVHAERKNAEDALNAQLKTMRDALEQKLLGERQRSQSLDTQLTAQISELRQLRAALVEAKDEREQLLSTLAAEREKLSAELKARDQSTGVLEADLRKLMQAHQDDFKAKLAATDKESARQLSLLQARATELEKALALQRAEAEERAAILKSEKTQSLEMLEARLSQEFAAREKGLHTRILELRDTLAARVAEVQTLSVRLRDTEQERSALDQYSTASHAESMLRREELEKQLAEARDHEQALETQCTAQISELKQLQSALQDVRAEREALLSTLAAEREKAAQELKGRQKAAAEIESALRKHFETQMAEGAARFEALQKRTLELEEKSNVKQAAIERLQAALKENEQARAVLERFAAEHQSESAARREELEKQTWAERERSHALETQLTVQVSELQALRSALKETQAEREQVLQTLAAERANASAVLQTEKAQSAAQDKEFRERLAAVHAESSQRQAALQARLIDLEKSVGEKQASLERLAETITHEEAKRAQAEKQWALEMENRRAAEALAAQQKTDFDAHLAALQEERKRTEDGLHARLLELRNTLAARAADIQKLELQLKETEQARAALDYYSTASHAENTQKRETLEGELRAERAQVQELDTRLTAQQSELQVLRSALEETKAEREQLLKALAAERQQSTEALKQQKSAALTSEALLRSQSEAKEKEFRDRLAALDKESEKRLAELQSRTVELEKGAAVQRSEFEQKIAFLQAEKTKSDKALQIQLSELQSQLTLKQADLSAVQSQLAAVQKEHSSFEVSAGETKRAAAERLKAMQQRLAALEKNEAEKQASLDRLAEAIAHEESRRAQAEKQWAIEMETRRAAEALAKRQKADFDAQMAALQMDHKSSEDALHARLLELRDTLAARAADIQKLDAQLKETEQARAALDLYSAANHADHVRKREILEGELRTERAHIQELDTTLAAQQSELKVLRSGLEETKAEREQLLKALAAERLRAAETLKHEKNSALTSEALLRSQSEAKEKEFRDRLSALDKESEKRLLELQTRTAELEKNAALQRSELKQRIAFLQAEKTKSDKQLQVQLSELQTHLTLKQADLESVQHQLAALQKEQSSFEAMTGESKKAAGERLKAMQQRVAALEKSEAEKQASLDRLTEAIAQEEARRAQAEKQWALEMESRRAAEALATRQKTEFDAYVSGLQTEHKASEDALHARLLELRNTLALRAADIKKLDSQLKETEQARAALDYYSAASQTENIQKRDALEGELRAERAHVQELDTELAAQQSELQVLRSALDETKAEREQLLKALAAERLSAAEALKQEKNAGLSSEALLRSQSAAKEKEFRERLVALDREAEKRFVELQTRTAELEKSSAAQRSDLEQRIALLQAEKTKSDKQLQIQLSELQTQVTLKQADLDAVQSQLAALQKEKNAFEATVGETKKAAAERLKAMQVRMAALEKSEGEKQAALDRLRETHLQLEAKCAQVEQQRAAEVQERHGVEALAAQQKKEFEAQLSALAAERKTSEAALHERLLELRHVLSARMTDIQTLEVQLKETEQARAALDQYSTSMQGDAARRREALEQQLAAERERAQAVETQLTTQVSELKQLQQAFETAREERAQLVVALAEAREKAATALRSQEITTTEREAAVRSQMEAQEKEFRIRLATADMEMERRLSALQSRAADLEKALASQRAEFEQRFAVAQAERSNAEKLLQGKLSDLHAQWVARGAELNAVEQHLSTVQKERDALALASTDQHKAYAQQLDALRQRARELEHEVREKQAGMERLQEAMKELEAHRAHAQDQWEKEAQERRSAQEAAAKAQEDFTQRLETTEAEHRAEEEALHERLIQVRTELDQRLNTENDKNQHLNTQLAGQMSELKQLRVSLDEARREREQLLSALSAEREKTALELKDRETLTTEQKRKYEQRLAAAEKEFRERLAAADAEAAKRITLLQARTSELEKTLAGQHSDHERQMAAQRSDYEQRLALLQAEQSKSEKTLQGTLSDLQGQLIVRTKDVEALQERLAQLQAQRQQWELTLSTHETASVQERQTFEERLSEARNRAAAVELELKTQTAAYHELQDALMAARKDGAALSKMVDEQQKKMQAELTLRETATVEQKKQYEARLAALEKEMSDRLKVAAREASGRMNVLQARAAELEQQGAEKQTLLDRLQETLTDLEAKRAHLETQWTLETKERRAAQETAARDKEQFRVQLAALQAERKAVEAELHKRLLDTGNALAARSAEAQRLERQFKEIEQERAALEQYSTASHGEMTKAQELALQQLHAERERAQGLETRLAAQTSELKQLHLSLADSRAEGDRLLSILETEREKLTREMKEKNHISAEEMAKLQSKTEAMEKEFRARLAAADSEHAQRLSALQARAAELEKTLMTQRSDYEKRLSALQVESIKTEKALQAQLSQAQTQLAAVSTERDATLLQVAGLEKEKGAFKKSTEEQKAAFALRLDVLQKSALALEQDVGEKQAGIERLQAALNQLEVKRAHWEAQHALRVQEHQALQKEADRDKAIFAKQYTELRSALDQRAFDVQTLEHQLESTQQAYMALEKKAVISQADAQKEKQTLELRWSEDKARVHELDLLIKANVAQIKDLKEALFSEQKQYKSSLARNEEVEQRMEEWRRRTTELERLGVEKQAAIDRLRDALAQTEAKKVQAEHQKDELTLRLEAIQAERKTAEDQLHARLNDLRVQLEHRIQEETSRARDLDAKVHLQAAELEQLRKAFTDESQERERLTKTLAAERERALVELKGREKTSTETASQLWTQMEAQEKEFRFQLATLEEESGRRIGLLQGRAAELEKALATQRSEFEQRLHGLQKERSESEEKLHVKIINLEEALNRRIAEAQALHAEFTAVESARAIADESAGSAHSEMVRQQKAFDERLAHEHLQARTLEQELQNYKSQARQWKETLDASKDDDKKRQALQKQLADMERELVARDQAASELRKQFSSLEEERDRLDIQVQREEEEKKLAVERALALESRLEKTRRDDLQAEQKMHAQLVDLSDQLERKGAALNVLEDRLQQLQKSNEDLSKALNRDSASWTRQKQELEEKLISERARLRDLEAEQVSQKAALRDLQDTLAAAEKERQQAQAALKSQKERFLSDLAQRDSGSAQQHRALELEREALNKEWQERLKAASQETLERMETLKRRADDLERQLAARQAELKQRHDQVVTLEADRRTLNEQIDSLNHDRKEESDAAAAERARLLERSRALEERLKEQSHELTVQLESVEETREKTRETLEYRLTQLQDQLAKRTAEVKSAQERLRVVEESRASMEKEAGQGQSQFTRERAQLEERLATERGRAKELAQRLNEVTAKMQETKESLAAAEEAQLTQRQKLAAQQENQKALQQRIQALERDAHTGTRAATGDASALERDLAARDAEIERLRDEAATLKTDMEQRYAAEIEKRVAEKLRDQMMNVLETGKLKNGDSSAMQALLEEWVFGFAHQVRNPLGIIRSVAESLLEATRRPSERDSLSAIMKAVDGLNMRLREFIEFSKPVKPLLQVVDVPSAVSAAIHLIEEKSLPKNVSIESTLPAAGTRIWMDPDHLRTILVQLLRNAVEAMPKGGCAHVTVAFDANRQQLDIRVQDEGVGISNGHMKEVGRPFFSTKPGAVGLGLALIKRLLRAYDGKLEIESRPGHSTTMICRMKAKIEEAGQWAA